MTPFVAPRIAAAAGSGSRASSTSTASNSDRSASGDAPMRDDESVRMDTAAAGVTVSSRQGMYHFPIDIDTASPDVVEKLTVSSIFEHMMTMSRDLTIDVAKDDQASIEAYRSLLRERVAADQFPDHDFLRAYNDAVTRFRSMFAAASTAKLAATSKSESKAADAAAAKAVAKASAAQRGTSAAPSTPAAVTAANDLVSSTATAAAAARLSSSLAAAAATAAAKHAAAATPTPLLIGASASGSSSSDAIAIAPPNDITLYNPLLPSSSDPSTHAAHRAIASVIVATASSSTVRPNHGSHNDHRMLQSGVMLNGVGATVEGITAVMSSESQLYVTPFGHVSRIPMLTTAQCVVLSSDRSVGGYGARRLVAESQEINKRNMKRHAKTVNTVGAMEGFAQSHVQAKMKRIDEARGCIKSLIVQASTATRAGDVDKVDTLQQEINELTM